MAISKVTAAGIDNIAAAVEGASDSNKFTDADHSKLNAIEASATADQTDAQIRTAVEAASDSNVFTDADHSKLNAIEASATADQSNAEIRTAVEAASDSNVFTDADHSKLNALDSSAYATAAQGTLATNALPKAGGTTTGNIRMNNKLSFNAAANASAQIFLRNTVVDDRALYIEGDETTAHTAEFYNNVAGSGRTGNVLRVYQDGASAAGSALFVHSDGDTSAIFSGGNVGIGTTAPAARVDISNGGGVAHYQITQASGNTAKFGIVSGSDIEISGTSNNDIYFKRAGSEKLRINSTGVAITGKITGAVGSVLQVVQAVKTDTFTTTSQSFTDITGLSQAITPSASSSKILITATLNIGNSDSSGHVVQVRLMRGNTDIALGDAAGNRKRVFAIAGQNGANIDQNNVSVNFLDSPSTTSATTYKVQIITEGQTAVVNRSGIDGNVAYAGRTISTITAQEIGA